MQQDLPVWGRRLVHRITCPSCWHSFFPENVLFVAKHPELTDDAVLGAGQFRRFEPRRFNLQGEAVDPKGQLTSELACPRCHLPICEAALEIRPLFLSIVGSPASGKSYFLTTMTWRLRALLPEANLTFGDADPVSNSAIHEYERTLFLSARPEAPTEIRKTPPDDPRLYRSARVDGVSVRFPVPLQFTLWPMPDHPRHADGARAGRIVVLYDNAGEDYVPSPDEATSAVVRHLARSHAHLFLFDPTQDPRLRQQCDGRDPQLTHGIRPAEGAPSVVARQEAFLEAAAGRIRRYLGLAANERLARPLIVVVPKFDIWSSLVDFRLDEEPYVGGNGDGPLRVRVALIERVSGQVRELLRRYCPEFVATAESLSQAVLYVPVSSLGHSPELIVRDGQRFYGIRPRDVRPQWVTVPLMYALCKWAPGIVADAADAPPAGG